MSFRRPSPSVEECSKAEKNGGGEAAVLPHIRLKRSEFSPANLNVEHQIPIHQYFRNIPGKSVKKKKKKKIMYYIYDSASEFQFPVSNFVWIIKPL